MLKENWRLISRLERVVDAMIVALSFIIAYNGRELLKFVNIKYNLGLPINSGILAPLPEHLVVFTLSLAVFLLALEWAGAYSRMRLASPFVLLRQTATAGFVALMCLGALLFALKIDVSRTLLGIFCALSVVNITLVRFLVLAILRFWRRRGKNYRQVILCGVGTQAAMMAQAIINRPELGLRIRAFVNLAEEEPGEPHKLDWRIDLRASLKKLGITTKYRFLSGISTLETALKVYAIDEVIFTDVTFVMPQVEESVLICMEQGVRTTVAADLFSKGLLQSGISYFQGIPLIHFQTPPGDRWELSVKRVLDLVLSLVGLVVLSPLLLVIAVAIKYDSKGPVMFRQKRVGLHGRLFTLLKFRSMVDGAEHKKAALAESNEMSGPAFKMKVDPRVTSVGKFIRRYSLDELPQLWNVFVGDMSLVGPRPPVPQEVNVYERYYRRRLSMRPGLTCTWQVSGRNDIKDFKTWVALDLEYIDNWSLFNDFKILIRTIPTVLAGAGR
jgi:exopolysaccharide biosynthesis polyprenyl glycosylphosphotransferase